MFLKDVKKKATKASSAVRGRISSYVRKSRPEGSKRKVLRSLARPNYSETRRNRRRNRQSNRGCPDKKMCLELEANAEQNQGYETRSRNLPDGHRNAEVILSNEKMSLTDMVDSKVLTRTASKTENDNTGSVTKNEQIPITSKEDSETHKTCPICQKTFDDEQAFTTHIKRHKESNDSNVCNICSKKLSSPSSLDRHKLVHTGERPFKCELCPVAFTTNGNMHRHMRTHAGERRKYGNEGDLILAKKRKLTNESVNGDECERAPGKRKTVFEKHDSNDGDILEPKRQVYKTSNTGNSKTFDCPVCSKWFISAESLDSHMDDHPNDFIECHWCAKVSDNYTCYKNHACSRLQACDTALQNPKVDKIFGFSDLHIIEFSSDTFPRIAKIACEEKPRYYTSDYNFKCKSCTKIFPCSRSLELHSDFCQSKIYNCTDKNQSEQNFTNKKNPGDQCASEKDDFLEKLELQRKPSTVCLEPLQIIHDSTLPKNPSNEISVMSPEVPTNSRLHCHRQNNSDFAEIPDIVSLASKASIPHISSPIIGVTASPENSVSPIIEDSNSSNFSAGNAIEDFAVQNITTSNKNDILSCSSKKISKKRLKQQNSNRSYSCDFCTYLCADKSTYVRHMRKHNGERPFICTICKYAFTTKANSCRHVQTKHQLPKEKAASVIEYNPNMSVTNSTENTTSENLEETVCKYCHEDFIYPRVLRHHVRSKFCLYKPYACQNCKLGFSTKNNCIRHITQKHPEYKDNIQDLIVINKQSSKSPQELYQHSESNECSTETSNIDDNEAENSENESPDFQNNLVELDNMQNNANDYHITDNENQSMVVEPNIDKHICIQYQSENQNSPCKEILPSQNSDNSEEDRVSIAQSLVCLSESIPMEGTEIDSATSEGAIIDCSVSGKQENYFVHENEISDEIEALDLTIRAIDLSANNVEKPERQIKIHSSYVSNSAISANKRINNPAPAHTSPVMTVVHESHLTNLNSAHLIRHDQNEIPYVHPQAAHISSVMNRFTNFDDDKYSSINLTQGENQTMPYLTEQPVPAHSSTIIYNTVSVQNQQTNSFDNNILIKRDQSTYVQPMPAHSSPVMGRTVNVENQLHGVAVSDAVQEEEKQSISCYLPSTRKDMPPNSVPNFVNTRPIFLNDIPSSSSTSYTPDTLHNPIRNEINNPNVSTKKQIQCEYCSKIFTLKSNKDRHVKNIHPEFAKPAHSRNSLGLKSDKDILKQVQNVSDRTKDRLRSVLIPKVNVLGPKSDHDAVDFEDKLISTIRSGTISEESNENSSQIIENDLQGQNSRNDSDLASVSSVINTANSKEIKKYLTSANVSDKFLIGKTESVSDSEMEQVNNAYRQLNGKFKEKYSCPQCQRGFPYKSSLQRHECTHTGAKYFTCPDCLTSCSTKSNLQRHLKNKCRMHILKSAQNFHEQNQKTSENAKDAEVDAKRHIAQFSNANEQSESSILSHQAGSYAVNNLSSSIFSGPTTTPSNSTLAAISFVASIELESMKVISSSFECRFCETTYKTKEDLTNHVKELHPSEYASSMRKL